MEKEIKKLLPGQRCDGYDGECCPAGNEIREKWIHKQVPKMLGDGEDDFVIIEKPVKIETANIQKEIEEQAKGCPSIKELIRECVESGDESCLNNHNLSYGDASEMPTDLHKAIQIVNDAKAKGMNLDDDKILTLSRAELNKLIDDAVKQMVNSSKPKDEPKQQEDIKGDDK